MFVSEEDGFISDFYGYYHSFYVALLTRRHPDGIFRAPGAKNQKLRRNALVARLSDYPRGVLLLCQGSRFAEMISFRQSGSATIGEISLALDPVRSFTLGKNAIELFRYEAVMELGNGIPKTRRLLAVSGGKTGSGFNLISSPAGS